MSAKRKKKRARSVQPQRLGRRSFLRGVLGGAGVAIGLPVLDIMLDDHGTAFADGHGAPVRFGVFYWGGGIVHDAWVPSSQGFDFALPGSLTPFEGALREYLTVVTGTSHPGSSPGHIPARGIALSSSHDMTVCTGDCVGVYRGQNHPEPSVDQLVVEHWTGATAYDSLEVGICRKGPYRSNSSWKRGGRAYNRHEPSPQAFYDRLFSGGVSGESTDTGLLETTSALERSMLDAVLDDAHQLSSRLGTTDRMRLEQHLDGLRAIERRLAERMDAPASGCTDAESPMRSDFGDGGSHEEKEAKAQIFSELLAVALACDMTRVFSFEWSATQSEAVYWEMGIDQEHHQYNHDHPRSDGMRNITRFIMQNLAYLAEQLRSMPEAGGNVLDNTLILGTSEHAVAGSHNYADHPYLFVGKAAGGLRAGQHWRHPSGGNREAPRVLLTAVRAVGVDAAELGQHDSDAARVATEPISDLLA